MLKLAVRTPALLAASTLACMVAVVGCSEGDANRPPNDAGSSLTFAFVPNSPSNFWKIAEAGVRKAEAEFGVEVEVRLPQSGAVDEQQQILQDLLTRQVDGIAISPIDPANMTRLLDEVAARTLLLTHDSDAPESQRIAYIGTNNTAAGRVAGEEILKVLPDGGDVILFVGRLDAQNARERKQGIEEALAGTNVAIRDVRLDYGDQARAQENAEAMIVAYPGIGALVGLWSYNGPAILKAVQAAGMVGETKIVCFDEDDATLQGIEEGAISATVVQKPFEFGYQSVRLLDELARGDRSRVPADGVIDTGVTVVDQGNVVEFRARLRELLR